MLLNVKGQGYYCPFPVGGIYISASNASPSSLWPGTEWSRIAAGTFLVASGGSTTGDYAVGKIGGAASVTLTVAQIPSHNHGTTQNDGSQIGWGSGSNKSGLVWDSHLSTVWASYTSSSGGGGAHENRPPYLAVDIWKRTK